MKRGILLIHGLGGTPYEMEPIGTLAIRLGIQPFYAKLPGHGGDPFEMEGVSLEDWIEYLMTLYSRIEHGYSSITVCGLSLGALLAGILARKRSPERLILLAPSVYPKRSAFFLAPFAGFIRGKLVRIADKSLNPESNIFIPMVAIKELWRAIRLFVSSLEDMDIPTLVLQGLSDEMVRIESAYLVKKRLGRKARLVLIPELSHVIPLDRYNKSALDEIREFLSWHR